MGFLAKGEIAKGLSREGRPSRALTSLLPRGPCGNKVGDTLGSYVVRLMQTHIALERDPGRDPLHGLQHNHTAQPGLLPHPLHPHRHRDPLLASAHDVHLRAGTGCTCHPQPQGPPHSRHTAFSSSAHRPDILEINQSTDKVSGTEPYSL